MSETTPSTWTNHRAIAAAFTSKASPTARHVLLAIARHCGGDDLGEARPSLRRLVELTGRTDKTVVAAIEELVRIGELEVVRHGGEGKRGGRGGAGHANRYRLLIPLPASAPEDRSHSDVRAVGNVGATPTFGHETSELLPETSEWLPENVGATPTEERRERIEKGERAPAPTSPAPSKGSTKASKPRPGDSLAVATWKQLTGIKRPAPAVVARIDGAVTDLETERWARVLKAWMAKGYKPGNVDGQLDWFAGVDERVPRELRIRREGATHATTAPAPRVPTDDADAPRDEALYPPGIAPALWHRACAIAAVIEGRHAQLDGSGSQRLALAAVAWIRATDPDAEPKRHAQALGELHAAATANDAAALAVLDAIALGAGGKAVACVA